VRRGPKRKALTVTAPTPVASDIPLCTSNEPEVASDLMDSNNKKFSIAYEIEKRLMAEKAASLLKNEIIVKNQKIWDLQKKSFCNSLSRFISCT
jgi:hypothetical protein